MKCPECGQWNRASMPHCTRCGAPLNIDAASRLEWKESLRDEDPGTAYIRVDEFGNADSTPDARDVLAREMQDLKKRKQEGAEKQKELRRNTGNEDTARIAGAEPERKSSWEELPPDAKGTIRMRRVSPEGLAAEQEAEIRHRVRYMDDTGSFIEPRSYDRVYDDPMANHHYAYASSIGKKMPSRARKRRKALHFFGTLLLVAMLATGGYFTWRFFTDRQSHVAAGPAASVTASMMDDLAAHTILIPGEDGQQIYIRELHASYVVSGGFATVQVADHTWYDNYEGTLEETMDVTMTPFLKTAAGRQTPLEPITYTIYIPLSPVTLDSPEALRTEVSTTMSTIQITVRPGSKVTVNGLDCSDTVSSETGIMSYNATVQPIGDNVFNIVVRSQYCRDNTLRVTLYRAPQEIPLDLAVGTYGTTYDDVIKVSATTLPGAYVEISSPHSDLDITSLDSTGKFSFNAIFDHIGDNIISITASYPGKKPSTVEHKVYYVPPADKYTVKAWPLSAEGYSELLSNTAYRASYGQVYVVTGVVQYSISEKPQMVVINTSEDGKSQPVLVQNYSRTSWVVGQYYRLYADAYSTYNSMPWLNARYTYTK
ncbi:MAG: zinc ribbon domain-containing protein [Clostridia bacterium]|nr:zinc ribbon domain-containing protein [Clostridia bacterium]